MAARYQTEALACASSGTPPPAGDSPLPGRPITAAHIKRANAYGLDRILDRVIDGETLRVIASDPLLNVSRPFLSQWLCGKVHDQRGPLDQQKARSATRRGLYEDARRMSAMSVVEDGRDSLDNETDPKMAQIANYRAAFRLKMAEVFDRERFGAAKVQVEVNIGNMHLDALRRRTIEAKMVGVLIESSTPDVEFLPAEAEGEEDGDEAGV